MRDKSSWDENGTIFRGWFREDATAKIWLKIICLVLGLFGIISGLFREDFGTSRIIPDRSHDQLIEFRPSPSIKIFETFVRSVLAPVDSNKILIQFALHPRALHQHVEQDKHVQTGWSN